jgi:hypothetical protein
LQSCIWSGELLAEPGHDPSRVAAITVQRAIDQSLQPRQQWHRENHEQHGDEG